MLQETQARRLYFIRALLQADTAGIFKTNEASEVIRPQAGESELLLVDRLMQQMEQRVERVAGHSLAPYYLVHNRLLTLMLFLCFCMGLFSNYLGPTEQVDLLANPLVSLILFNLAIFTVLLLRLCFRAKGPTPLLPNMLYHLADHLPVFAKVHGEMDSLLRKARLAARTRWFLEQSPLVALRLTRALHSCAAVLVSGALGGLYLRGLARAYSFHWHSTFVPEPSREGVLAIIFAPITTLSGLSIPPLAEGNGAAWINLLALTAIFYVIVPRLLLATFYHLRYRKQASQIQINTSDSFFRDLLTQQTSLERQLSLVGYSYRFNPERQQQLLVAARLLWGERTRHLQSQEVAWGETEITCSFEGGRQHVLLVCFSGAQTPEEEVHTPFAQNLHTLLNQNPSLQFLALVDAARVDANSAERRRDAWTLVLSAAGIRNICWVDLSMDTPSVVEAINASLRQRKE